MTNNGSGTLNGWTVRLTLASGQAISSLWSGVNSGTTGSITVRNAAYNGSLGAMPRPRSGSPRPEQHPAPSNVGCTSP